MGTLFEKSKSFSKWVATKFFDSDEQRTNEVVEFFLGNPQTGPAKKGSLTSVLLFALYKARDRELRQWDAATKAGHKESGVVTNTTGEYIDSMTRVGEFEQAKGMYPIKDTEDAIKGWANYFYESAKEIFKKGGDN